MAYRVEEAFQVDAHRIAIALTYYLGDTYQCILRSPVRAEAETALTELAFIDREFPWLPAYSAVGSCRSASAFSAFSLSYDSLLSVVHFGWVQSFPAAIHSRYYDLG